MHSNFISFYFLTAWHIYVTSEDFVKSSLKGEKQNKINEQAQKETKNLCDWVGILPLLLSRMGVSPDFLKPRSLRGSTGRRLTPGTHKHWTGNLFLIFFSHTHESRGMMGVLILFLQNLCNLLKWKPSGLYLSGIAPKGFSPQKQSAKMLIVPPKQVCRKSKYYQNAEMREGKETNQPNNTVCSKAVL